MICFFYKLEKNYCSVILRFDDSEIIALSGSFDVDTIDKKLVKETRRHIIKRKYHKRDEAKSERNC